MNKNILFVMDNQLNPDKYTEEEIIANAKDAANYKDAADYATAASKEIAGMGSGSYFPDAVHLVNVYFRLTKEDKQKYLDEIKKGSKQ